MIDFTFTRRGGLVVVKPLTAKAWRWVGKNLTTVAGAETIPVAAHHADLLIEAVRKERFRVAVGVHRDDT